jgi:hypothetical protein
VLRVPVRPPPRIIVHDLRGPIHLFSQGPGPWPAKTWPPDIFALCGVGLRSEGTWRKVRVLSVELVAHVPGVYEDQPMCEPCLRELAAHPPPTCLACDGTGGYLCKGVRATA